MVQCGVCPPQIRVWYGTVNRFEDTSVTGYKYLPGHISCYGQEHQSGPGNGETEDTSEHMWEKIFMWSSLCLLVESVLHISKILALKKTYSLDLK